MSVIVAIFASAIAGAYDLGTYRFSQPLLNGEGAFSETSVGTAAGKPRRARGGSGLSAAVPVVSGCRT